MVVVRYDNVSLLLSFFFTRFRLAKDRPPEVCRIASNKNGRVSSKIGELHIAVRYWNPLGNIDPTIMWRLGCRLVAEPVLELTDTCPQLISKVRRLLSNF